MINLAQLPRPKNKFVNCETGEETEIPFTDEEYDLWLADMQARITE